MSDRSPLAELAELAGNRGWTEVTAFLGSCDDEVAGRLPALIGAQVDAAPLFDWIAGLDGAPAIQPGPLAVEGDEDGAAALLPRRVLVVLRCATPIRSSDLIALRVVRERPAGSYLIVFVGAELAGTEDELDLLERGVRRSVPTLPGDAVHGPLAERGIALWAHGKPAGPVGARLQADRARVVDWVCGDTAGDGLELARLRARHGLALARTALAAPRRDRARPDTPAAALLRLHSSLLRIRPAVLQRLDAETALMRSDLEAAFTEVRTEIVASTADLVRAGAADHTGAFHRHIDEHVGGLLRRWEQQRADGIRRTGAEAVASGVTRLLRSIDWDVVNELVALPPGAAYPEHLITPAAALSGTPQPVTIAPHHPAPGRVPRAGTRRTACLTAGGAMVGLLGYNPVAALGGATAGFVVDRVWNRMDESERRRELWRAAVARARHVADGYWSALDEAQGEQARRVRAEVHTRLRALEQALLDRIAADSVAPDSPPDDQDVALDALHRRVETTTTPDLTRRGTGEGK